MLWLQAQMVLLDTASAVVGFLTNWLLQSTLLIAADIAIGRLLQCSGAAVQSVVYRTTLAAIVVCPLMTWLLSLGGVSGWAVRMPSAWSYEPAPVTVAVTPPPATEPAVPARESETAVTRTESQLAEDVGELPQVPIESPAESRAPARDGSLVVNDVYPVESDHEASMVAAPRALVLNAFGFVAIGLSLLWMATSAGLLIRLAIARRHVDGLRRRAIQAEPAVLEMCCQLACAFHIDPPAVLRSPYVSSPFLAGVRHPAVLLPETGLELPLREVLIHELAHLERRDCHWNLFRQVMQAVHCFQPLLWMLSRRLDAAAEEVCDDYVMHFGGDREGYARRLVDLAELSTAPMVVAGVGMVSLRSLLARRVMRIMDRSRSLSTRAGHRLLWSVLAGGLAWTIVIGFVGLGTRSSLALSETAAGTAVSEAPDKATDAVAQEAHSHEYAGQVVDPNGQPVAGAKIHLVYYVREPTAPLVPSWQPRAVTDSAGQFRFSMSDADYGAGANSREWKAAAICAVAEGYGFAWSTAALFESSGTTLEELRERLTTAPADLRGALQKILNQAGQPLRLTMDDQPIRGQMIDINGAPVAGAKVTLIHVDTGLDESLDGWLAATKRERADFYSAREMTPKSINGPQVRSLVVPAVTDREGRFVLRGVGRNRIVKLLLEGPGVQSDKLDARTQLGDKVQLLQQWSAPDHGKFVVHPAELLHVAGPSKPIIGIVRDKESGAPIPGVTVLSQKRHGHPISGWGQDFVRTVTNAEGHYRLEGMPIGDDNQIAAIAPAERAYLSISRAANTGAAVPEVKVDFSLPPGVWVNGRVTDKSTGQDLSGTVAYFAFNDNPHLKAAGRLGFIDERERHQVGEDGRFRIAVFPGRGIVAFQAHDHEKYPRGAGADQIEGAKSLGGGMPYFPTQPGYCLPKNHHVVAEVSPERDRREISLDLQLDAGIAVSGRVIDANGKPIDTAWYSGQLKEFANWRRVQSDGIFSVNSYDPTSPRQLVFCDREHHLAGHMVLSGPVPEPFEVRLEPAGTIKGRLVDDSGDPLSGMRLLEWIPAMRSPAAMAPQGTPRSVPLPPNDRNQEHYATDEQGRFEIEGLAPGVDYRLRAIERKTTEGERARRTGPVDAVIRVKPGETLDVGDVRITTDVKFNQTNGQGAAAETPAATKITGRVTGVDGRPAVGAHVAAIARRLRPSRGGDLTPIGEVLASAVTDKDGGYEMRLTNVSSKSHAEGHLIARRDGAAIAWQPLDLDVAHIEVLFSLAAEEPIRGRLVDIEGQPAANIPLWIQSVTPKTLTGQRPRPFNSGYQLGRNVPAAWIAPVTSDAQGRFTIHGIPAEYGVSLGVEGSGRFAPQHLALNTGQPEQRGADDRTYRSLVKNAVQGDEAVLALAPAQPFEGTVRYSDTGAPAPNARLTIWASQQEFGSMISVAGSADAQGRYQLQPYPGIRFGVTAYPPPGVPYLARQTAFENAIRWEAGDILKQVDVALPRGVLLQGRVVEKGTQQPVAGASVQYVPESANNRNASNEILTGWQDMQISDADGRFQIAVLPGPGRLLAHGPQADYVLQETSGRELGRGTPGGPRNYAHAIHKIDLQAGQDALDVTLELQRGATVTGRIVDERQQPVEPVLIISRLNISPATLHWRGDRRETYGGTFQLTGLDGEREYPVCFLDPKRQMGATVRIRAGSEPLTVVMKPCGKATVRFVDEAGQPLAGLHPSLQLIVTPGALRFDLEAMKAGMLAADSDFVANIDRTNYWDGPKCSDEGRVTLPALIPGATYQLEYTGPNGRPMTKEVIVESQQTLDLGDIVSKER